MYQYEKAELELNKYPDPTNFHDMSVIDMKFLNDTIHIRFILAKYMDSFGILKDENHYAVLDVVYRGIKIIALNLEGLIDFRNSSVFSLEENNGIISLNLYNITYDNYYDISFSYNDYKWSIKDVISIDEYYKFSNSIKDYVDEIIKIQEIKTPDWAKI